jgi:hypothetical protein
MFPAKAAESNKKQAVKNDLLFFTACFFYCPCFLKGRIYFTLVYFMQLLYTAVMIFIRKTCGGLT